MAGTFTIKVKSEFAAAHALRGYEGNCARLHGHNWKIQADVETTQLNEIGIGVDFKDIKSQLSEILGCLDHQYLNDIPPFDKINPTAENVVAWIFEQLEKQLNSQNCQLAALTLWETDRSSVTYRKND